MRIGPTAFAYDRCAVCRVIGVGDFRCSRLFVRTRVPLPPVLCARDRVFVLCRRGRARLCRGVSAFPPFAIPICKVSLGLGVIGR